MGELSPFAIRSIRACADKLAAGDVIPLPPDNPHPFAGKVGYELWFPVVHALVRTITAANMDNRCASPSHSPTSCLILLDD